MALTNSQKQQRRRDKLRAIGLVKVELWVKPEHKQYLKGVEKKLRGNDEKFTAER